MTSELKRSLSESIKSFQKALLEDTCEGVCVGCGEKMRIFKSCKTTEVLCSKCETEQEERKFREEYLKTLLSAGYISMSFDSFKLRENNKNLKIAVEKAKDFFKSDLGIYLYGKSGQGKTHLLISAFKDCILKGGYAKLLKYSSEALKYNGADYKNASRKAEIIEEYSNCKYLFIDDYGSVGNKDDMSDMLYCILQNRIENGKGKKVFITSNLAIPDIRDERLKSRIVGMCSNNKEVNIIELKGKDIRTEGYI